MLFREPAPVFERITVAYDGSGPARAAEGVAFACASRWHAQLILCYALDVNSLLIPATAGAGIEAGDILDIYRQEALNVLAERARECREAGVACETVLCDEPVPDAILHEAGEGPGALIVIGTHGRSGAARALFGSTAESVFRNARVAVMTVREHLPRAGAFKDIVVAVDDSSCAAAALDAALRVAVADRGRIHVVHVVPDDEPEPLLPRGMEHVRRAAAAARRSGTKVFEYFEAGPAAAKICAFAERLQANLVAVGSHGRSGVARALMGSVAEGVVRRAPCPVLVTKGA